MEGWRARIGLIVPAGNATMEPDLQTLARGSGIAVLATRVWHGYEVSSAEAMLELNRHTDGAAALLGRAGVDLVVYGCTSGSFVGGRGTDVGIANRMAKVAGVPAITTTMAVVEALRHLNCERIYVVTPYLADVNEAEVRFFTDSGFDVTGLGGPRLATSAERRNFPPGEIYRVAKASFATDSDALFISCTNFPSLSVIGALERDLGKPVVTSNQASWWYALRTLGVREPVPGYGSLLS